MAGSLKVLQSYKRKFENTLGNLNMDRILDIELWLTSLGMKFTSVTQENVLFRYLGVKCHYIYNLPSNGSVKNYIKCCQIHYVCIQIETHIHICTHKERELKCGKILTVIVKDISVCSLYKSFTFFVYFKIFKRKDGVKCSQTSYNSFGRCWLCCWGEEQGKTGDN